MIKRNGFLLVTVQEEATGFTVKKGRELKFMAGVKKKWQSTKSLPPGSWQLIGLAAELTERQWEGVSENLELGLDNVEPKTTVILKLIEA